MFKKWKEKRLAASFNNAVGISEDLIALKQKAGLAFDFSVAPRGSCVVIATNIPARYPGRDHVEIAVTPHRLIAKGDVVPYGRSAVVPDSVTFLAAKPDAVARIATFVESYAVKRHRLQN